MICVWLAAGGLACNSNASPTTPSASPSAVTETFASQFGMRGSASRSFTVSETGTVSVILTSVGPPSDVVVGLGVGIPRATGAGCNLSQSVNTPASSTPQVTTTAEAGAYCVRVFDVGNLTGDVSFSIAITHP